MSGHQEGPREGRGPMEMLSRPPGLQSAARTPPSPHTQMLLCLMRK